MRPDLSVRWFKRGPQGEEDGPNLYYIGYPPNGGMLAHFFETVKVDGKSLREELQDRGFDLSTLRFSIRKRQPTTEGRPCRK